MGIVLYDTKRKQQEGYHSDCKKSSLWVTSQQEEEGECLECKSSSRKNHLTVLLLARNQNADQELCLRGDKLVRALVNAAVREYAGEKR